MRTRKFVLLAAIAAAGTIALAVFLAALIGLQAGDRASGAPPPIVSGDVNCSGSVAATDALLILRRAAGLTVSADCMAAAGDVNCSGAIDAVDSLLVLRYVAGLLVELPPGCPFIGGPLPPGRAGENLAVNLVVSKPANGTHFVAGEQPVLTITLKDQMGNALNRANDFTQLRLMAAGPIETTETTTPVKLLKTTADRSVATHHYVDLKTNAEVQVSGAVLTYRLAAVSDEKPGTYIASVWAVSKADSFQQVMTPAEFQIGTATIEKQIVEPSKCAQCHLGADSGKFYFHHIDQVSAASPAGNFSIDQNAVRNCKTCHNNDGYAAYNGLPGAPATENPNLTRVPDPIVRRVHGVHMGEGLAHTFNTDPVAGDFADYIHVVFPANVKNCTYCHVDDRYKTQPSRLACGACHDNIWFGEQSEIPPEMAEHNMELHPGGVQRNDSLCSACHPPDTGGVKSVAEAHKVDLSTAFTVALTMSAPANGKAFVAGEKPTLTITFKDAATDAVVNPATVTEAVWNRVSLQVSGPRENTQPVLTTAAIGSTTSSYRYNDLRVRTDPAKEDPKLSRSATAITYQLDGVAGLESGTYTVFAQARKVAGSTAGVALINFQVGTATVEPRVATGCTACHGNTNMHGSYPFALAPDLCKSCHDYERQLSGKTGWNSSNNGYGAAPIARRVHGVHFGRYLDKPEEVHGVADAEFFGHIIFPQDVRNCTKCHTAETSGTWKTEPSRVACLACHDSDAAILHGTLMTLDLTPAEPYSGDELETCVICHGEGRDFSPDKVHNISDPYKPPYPREPVE